MFVLAKNVLLCLYLIFVAGVFDEFPRPASSKPEGTPATIEVAPSGLNIYQVYFLSAGLVYDGPIHHTLFFSYVLYLSGRIIGYFIVNQYNGLIQSAKESYFCW